MPGGKDSKTQIDEKNKRKGISGESSPDISLFGSKKPQIIKKPKTITIVITGEAFTNAIFWVKLIDRVESELKRNGIEVKLLIIDGPENNFLNGNSRTDGFIVIGTVDKKYLWEIEKCNLPVFLVDYKHLYIKHDHIRMNNELGMRYLTEKILQKGHRDMIFLGDIYLASSIEERYNGVKYALQENKNIETSLQWLEIKHGLKTIEERDKFLKLIKGDKHPTVVIASQDSIAIDAINVLKKAKIKVPDDVSVVGFDNINESNFIVPKLTTVDVAKAELAALAVETVIKKFQNPQKPNLLIMIEPKIIERESLVERRNN